ncbi:hypothetical protein CES92_11700 [Enterobacter roggenkampii]|nr:hypothetical protein CES92_11700 [Enterobacter roggenkampii]
MMSLWDALRMNMMISYQELVRTFPSPFAYITPILFCSSGLISLWLFFLTAQEVNIKVIKSMHVIFSISRSVSV